jgi:hypothetical protein
MSEALPAHAAEEQLAGGVLPGRAIGCAQLRDPACRRDPGKLAGRILGNAPSPHARSSMLLATR